MQYSCVAWTIVVSPSCIRVFMCNVFMHNCKNALEINLVTPHRIACLNVLSAVDQRQLIRAQRADRVSLHNRGSDWSYVYTFCSYRSPSLNAFGISSGLFSLVAVVVVVVVVVVGFGVRVHSKGPMRESTTGSKINPCPAPNVTKPMKALNIVVKISLVLKASGSTPKNVEREPRRIDDPMVRNVSLVFSFLFSPGVS